MIERILQKPHAFYQANEYYTLYTWMGQLPETLLAQNIYRKLDAHNRAKAVEVARQLHLLS